MTTCRKNKLYTLMQPFFQATASFFPSQPCSLLLPCRPSLFLLLVESAIHRRPLNGNTSPGTPQTSTQVFYVGWSGGASVHCMPCRDFKHESYTPLANFWPASHLTIDAFALCLGTIRTGMSIWRWHTYARVLRCG